MKTVVIVSKSWRSDVPKILNATGHLAQSIAQQTKQEDQGKFVDYETLDKKLLEGISVHPYVVLTGTPAKMWSFKEACEEEGIICTGFVETMFNGGTEKQLESTSGVSSRDHNLVCVGAFGESLKLDPLTKKFSLFRS